MQFRTRASTIGEREDDREIPVLSELLYLRCGLLPCVLHVHAFGAKLHPAIVAIFDHHRGGEYSVHSVFVVLAAVSEAAICFRPPRSRASTRPLCVCQPSVNVSVGYGLSGVLLIHCGFISELWG